MQSFNSSLCTPASSNTPMDVDTAFGSLSLSDSGHLGRKVVSKELACPSKRLSSDIWSLIGQFACSTIEEYSSFSRTCITLCTLRSKVFQGNSDLVNHFFDRFGYETATDQCLFDKIPKVPGNFIKASAFSLKSFRCESALHPDITEGIVTTFKNIENLSFNPRFNTRDGKGGNLARLAFLPLRELNISTSGTIIFKDIATISTLQKLSLSSEIQMDDPRDFTRLQNLTFLDLTQSRLASPRDNSSIGDVVAPVLFTLRNLQSLNLFNTCITNEGLGFIGKVTNLTSLSLRNCPVITEKGLAALKDLHHLRELDLSSTQVTNRVIFEYVGNKHLTKLDLGRCKNISYGFLDGLQHIKCLEELSVASTTCGDSILAGIDRAINLTLLDLGNIPYLHF